MAESSSLDTMFSEAEEELLFCERMISSESRLDLVIRVLEEIREKLKSIQELDIRLAERKKSLEDRVNILYHRAKTLLNMGEETKSLQDGSAKR
jgi:hypothetical protein